MQTTPQQEHQWLQTLVGEWTYESEALMGPGQPPVKMTGTESVRTLGGLWFQCELQGDCPGGGPSTMQITLGYDPNKKRYIGTFIGSMTNHLWLYDGEVDGGGKVLTLEAEGPSFTDPTKMARYRDVIEIKSHDHRVLTSHLLGDDGQWHNFMTAHYRRAA